MTAEESVSAALDDVQAKTIGFTGHEWAYLLSLNATPAAHESAATFRLGADWKDESVIAIGASSLLVRDLLVSPDGTSLEPVGAASWGGALGTLATRWTEFAVVTDDFTEASILLEADESRALVQPRALGTWWFTPMAPAASRGDIHAVVVRAIDDVAGPIGITLRSATVDSSATLTARRIDGLWGAAIGATGAPEPTTTRDGITTDELAEMLTTWLNEIDGP